MTALTPEMQALLDRTAITECVRRWPFYRDGHHWAKLRDLYTVDGRMTTTWTIATADEFVAHCKAMAEKGGGRQSMHSLSATIVDINLRMPHAQDSTQSEFTQLMDVSLAYRKIDWEHTVAGTSGSDDWRAPLEA